MQALFDCGHSADTDDGLGGTVVRLSSKSLKLLVGEVGVATSKNFNAVVCPASAKVPFACKGQFPELSSAAQAQ
jgi:hypothetical protein